MLLSPGYAVSCFVSFQPVSHLKILISVPKKSGQLSPHLSLVASHWVYFLRDAQEFHLWSKPWV